MPPWWAVVLAVVAAGFLFLFWMAARAGAIRRKWDEALAHADSLTGPGAVHRRRNLWETSEPAARFGVALSLSQNPDADAFDMLQAAFDENWADIRTAAATALGELKGDAAVEVLLERGLADKNGMVRAAAIESLGLIGSAEGVEPIADRLRSAASRGLFAGYGRTIEGLRAAEALGKIGTPEAIEALRDCRERGPLQVQRAVEAALGVHEVREEVESGEATVETFEKLAGVALARRNYREAHGWLTQALELDENTAALQHLMGLVEQRMGNSKEAQARYERAIELDPEEPFPHFGLGVLLAEGGYRKRAIECFREYLRLAPEGDQALAAREHRAALEQG